MRGRILAVFLSGLVCTAGAAGSDFSLRLYGGWSYVDGGDLNKSIASWDAYHWNRRGSSFTALYNLDTMHDGPEFGAEAVLRISGRWSLGLAVGYASQRESGQVFTRSTWKEETTASFPEPWIVDFEEKTEQRPRYARLTIPVTLSLDYALVRGSRWTLTLGAGAGVYWGRLELQEPYNITSESAAEVPTPDGIVRYVDDLRTSGEYSERLTGAGFGLHGRLGFEYRLSSSVFLTVSLLGRWVEMRGWEGSRRDAYEWEWTYGLWGSSSAEGSEERAENGQLWNDELRDDLTGRSYPILVFGESAPSPGSRPANINLTGISVRLGLGFRFGGQT